MTEWSGIDDECSENVIQDRAAWIEGCMSNEECELTYCSQRMVSAVSDSKCVCPYDMLGIATVYETCISKKDEKHMQSTY